MAGRTCALLGCSKPCVDPHLACGEVHHLLLMAGRYRPSLPHPHQLILDRNASNLCALPSCSELPWPSHAWCSRTHYLAWLNDFYTNLSPHQICKLPGCTRHVFVEDSTDGDKLPFHEFCGWRHRQKFVMRNALQQHPQPPPTQRDCGHVPSVKSLMHAFKLSALSPAVDPASIKVDTDFFSKHPWEVLTEGMACFLIAQCKFTWKRKNAQRDMVTKDHYHWKQQGPPKEKDGFSRKYFRYKKLRGKKKEGVEHYDDRAYTMKEYSMDECNLYCLVKLCKGGYKQHKGKKVHTVSQDSVFPRLDHDKSQFLESSEEQSPVPASIYEGLPPIVEWPFNLPL